MITVSMVNMKGGVGKTSACLHLSHPLAQRGHRVLLCDCDPQASLTQGVMGPDGAFGLDQSRTVAALFSGSPDPDDVVLPGVFPGVSLVPGSMRLSSHNTPDRDHWGERQGLLNDFLRCVAPEYDFCLIDCPPNLHLCSWSALLASDAAVVPLQTEDFGSQGIAPVKASVDAARLLNPGLRLAGYLLTMVDRRLGVHATFEAALRERYGDLVFREPMARAADYAEAVTLRRPVGLYKPRGKAAKNARAIADELVERVAAAPAEAAA